MLEIIAVFVGGSLGAAFRYLLSQSLSDITSAFYPTFLVNLIGSFIIGAITFLLVKKPDCVNNKTKLFLTTGFCGGFTTFSTFCLDFFKLIQTNQMFLGFTYLFMSLFAGLLAVMLGFIIAEKAINIFTFAAPVLQEEYEDEISEEPEAEENLLEV